MTLLLYYAITLLYTLVQALPVLDFPIKRSIRHIQSSLGRKDQHSTLQPLVPHVDHFNSKPAFSYSAISSLHDLDVSQVEAFSHYQSHPRLVCKQRSNSDCSLQSDFSKSSSLFKWLPIETFRKLTLYRKSTKLWSKRKSKKFDNATLLPDGTVIKNSPQRRITHTIILEPYEAELSLEEKYKILDLEWSMPPEVIAQAGQMKRQVLAYIKFINQSDSASPFYVPSDRHPTQPFKAVLVTPIPFKEKELKVMDILGFTPDSVSEAIQHPIAYQIKEDILKLKTFADLGITQLESQVLQHMMKNGDLAQDVERVFKVPPEYRSSSLESSPPFSEPYLSDASSSSSLPRKQASPIEPRPSLSDQGIWTTLTRPFMPQGKRRKMNEHGDYVSGEEEEESWMGSLKRKFNDWKSKLVKNTTVTLDPVEQVVDMYADDSETSSWNFNSLNRFKAWITDSFKDPSPSNTVPSHSESKRSFWRHMSQGLQSVLPIWPVTL